MDDDELFEHMRVFHGRDETDPKVARKVHAWEHFEAESKMIRLANEHAHKEAS